MDSQQLLVEHLDNSCYIITISNIANEQCRILYDHPGHSLQSYTGIDVILCSNAQSLNNLLRYVDIHQFTGLIYSTWCNLVYHRMFQLRFSVSSHHQLSKRHRTQYNDIALQKQYIKRVIPVTYDQYIQYRYIIIKVNCSGYSAGSAYYSIILNDTNVTREHQSRIIINVLNSINVSKARYCKSIDMKYLKQSDIIIYNNAQLPNVITPSSMSVLTRHIQQLIDAQNNNQSYYFIQLPLQSDNIIYDIIEYCTIYIQSKHSNIPVILIGDHASTILNYTTYITEYCNVVKQNRAIRHNYITDIDKSKGLAEPFNYQYMIQQKRLFIVDSINHLPTISHQSSIYVTIEPTSDATADIYNMLTQRASVQPHVLLLADTVYQSLDTMHLTPSNTVSVIQCPINPALNINETQQLITHCKPNDIICFNTDAQTQYRTFDCDLVDVMLNTDQLRQIQQVYPSTQQSVVVDVHCEYSELHKDNLIHLDVSVR